MGSRNRVRPVVEDVTQASVDDSLDRSLDRSVDRDGRGPRIYTKLTSKIAHQLCKFVRQGDTADCACDLIGISHTTLTHWLAKGKKYIDSEGTPAEYAIFGEFYQNFRRAMAKYRQGVRRQLMKANFREWTKYMTLLERRDRKNYGRRDYVFNNNVASIEPQAQYL